MSKNPKLNPVVLVHGIVDTVAVFNNMSRYLSALGWSVHSLNLSPNNGKVGLDQLAQQVAVYIERNFPASQPLDLLGFSMGGLVTRYYLQRLDGIERVQRYISISAPNNGTLLANFLSLPGIVQMRPNSNFLEDLNHDVVENLGQINYTCMWTPFDAMIVPAQSSRLPIGREVKIPVWIHAWMLRDQRVLKAVAAALTEGVKD